MGELKNFNELYQDELVAALNSVYPIRAKLQETLIDTYDDELLGKVILLNKIIEDAEILLRKKEEIKKFYAERHPEYVEGNNERGLLKLQSLKKKWKTLGYLNKKY